ncbi:MAG TPA: ATP-binding protein [Oculatellaceae cyanobacterium]
MEITDAQVLEVAEHSQVGDARRRVVRLATEAGLDAKAQDRLSVITTELATNLLKHTAAGGRILMQALKDEDIHGIELCSIDSGRGMNVEDCVLDGVSSTGTLGTGLGAIRRMSDECNIFSQIGSGTVVHVRVWNSPPKTGQAFSFGGFTVPKNGEHLSGDKWMVLQKEGIVYSMLVDGLGHGLEAFEAAQLAKQSFRENWHKPPVVMMNGLHAALRGSRGAVGAVARLNLADNRLDYCGLGNVTAIVVSELGRKHLVSMNGTLGYDAPRFREFSYVWTPSSLLVMHSDGLSSRAGDAVVALEKLPAPLVAGWLYQQHAKTIDDATVLVLKQSRPL